jgi:hypothetical protein
MIKAVMNLKEDESRRGPFHIQVQNDPYPGRFNLLIAAYLFKQSSKIMGAVKAEKQKSEYSVIEVEDYFALSFTIPLSDALLPSFINNLYRLLRYTDRIERESTNFDLSVFE